MIRFLVEFSAIVMLVYFVREISDNAICVCLPLLICEPVEGLSQDFVSTVCYQSRLFYFIDNNRVPATRNSEVEAKHKRSHKCV
jgi:hypothetical protein